MRIGIDIGGTKLEAVAIDEELNVLAAFRGPVRYGPTGVTATALETSPLIASLRQGAITHLLDDERPTHAIGAAIMGAQHG